MCMIREDRSTVSVLDTSKRRQHPKKPKLQVIGLTRRRCGEGTGEKDMEIKNLKLYLENKTILEENEKLREKAYLLHRENLALMREFQEKFPHFDRFSAALFLLYKY
ncbi:Protein LITTLE ZIPPER 2 [Linum grandiflorum]